MHKKTCCQNLAWKLKHCTSGPRNSQRLSWIWILKLRYTKMSACANTQTHTQNFKTRSSTRANSAIFLLVTLTWAQFHLKLVGRFFLSQACRIKPAGSRQTTTEVFRSLVFQDRYPDLCRGREDFFFACTIVRGYNPCLPLKCELSKTFLKKGNPDGAVFWFKVTD